MHGRLERVQIPFKPPPHERGTDAELCVSYPLYAAQTQFCPDVRFCANIVALLAQNCRRRLRSFQPS